MSNEIIVRVYGDSICNPRYKQDIPLEYIWPELLKNKLKENFKQKIYLYNKSQNNTDIETARRLFRADEGCFCGADFVAIVQLGIVDCAPRPVPPKVRDFISKLPDAIKNKIIKFLHENRKTILKIKSHNTTPIKPFKKAYKNMVSHCKDIDNLICIGIGPVSESMKNKSYGLEEAIISYNKAIQSICKKYNCQYIDMNKLFREKMAENNYTESDVLLEDGHHYTKLGHTIALDIIYDTLITLPKIKENLSYDN